MKQMMEGEITSNKPDSGNVDKVRFYVCSTCGNILVSTGSASIFCCGRKLERLSPTISPDVKKITVEEIDTDYFITFDHPMSKEHYISFVAYVKTDRIFLNRLYPEQSPTCRFPITKGGKLYVYCIQHGLMTYTEYWF
jgi:desulfoferrodoxin (superoxide reductase-like protein)